MCTLMRAERRHLEVCEQDLVFSESQWKIIRDMERGGTKDSARPLQNSGVRCFWVAFDDPWPVLLTSQTRGFLFEVKIDIFDQHCQDGPSYICKIKVK